MNSTGMLADLEGTEVVEAGAIGGRGTNRGGVEPADGGVAREDAAAADCAGGSGSGAAAGVAGGGPGGNGANGWAPAGLIAQKTTDPAARMRRGFKGETSCYRDENARKEKSPWPHGSCKKGPTAWLHLWT